jgi:hypothetical protein
MFKEDDNKIVLHINNIINNYEDHTNAVPNYFEVIPDTNSNEVDNIPIIKLKFNNSLNCLEMLDNELVKLKFPKEILKAKAKKDLAKHIKDSEITVLVHY